MADKIRIEFIVQGFVQGVGYRYFVYRHASILNVYGYVKNLFNGDVQVIAEGRDCDIDALELQLRIGPSRAVVDNIYKNYLQFKGDFNCFEIK